MNHENCVDSALSRDRQKLNHGGYFVRSMNRKGALRLGLFLGLLLGLAGPLWSNDLHLRSSVDKTEISKGETMTYHLQLEWDQAQEKNLFVT
ncbi:MAG: hypothetical protein NC930_07780, partial [Candidatus Omnitrophica bacterium]|nr:hypothetical protein [Candidatus Omnitrophota bacterium]